MIRTLLGVITPTLFLVMSTTAAESSSEGIFKDKDIDTVTIVGFKQIEQRNIAASNSIVSSLQFKNNELPNIKDLSAVLPNLFIPDYGSKVNTPIFIRGIGAKTADSPIALYVDGVPHFEKSAFDFELAEVSSVELLRGPQGTLYGRNTAGGVINVTTPSPMDEQYTLAKLSYATANEIQAMLSTHNKIGDKFGFSLMGNYHHSDGYFKNVCRNEYADKFDSALGRVSLVYRPNENWQHRLSATCDYTDQNGYPYAIYDTETGKVGDVDYEYPSLYIRKILTVGHNSNYVGEKMSFNSQTSYQRIDDHYKMDQDFTSSSIYQMEQFKTQDQVSQEFTVKSNTSSRYQHITGMFAFWLNVDRQINLKRLTSLYGNPKYTDTESLGLALYHQSMYSITDKFTALVGLRFDTEFATQNHTEYLQDIDSSGNNTGEEVLNKDLHGFLIFNQLTPKFTLKYDFTPKNMIYASVTRGYKAGGFNTLFPSDEYRTYDPEYNWTYEIGAKQSMLNNRLIINLDIFYIDWKNQQLSVYFEDCGNVDINAGRTTSKGVEVSVTARPTNNINIMANYGYTDAKFEEYETKGVDYAGKYLSMVPRHTASLFASYTFYDPFPAMSRLMFSANAKGSGELYWDDANQYKQDFYTLIGCKASAEFNKKYTVEVWGKNITNVEYMSYVFNTATKAQQGKPRSLGCSFICKF